jgi:hypothetical protein
VVPSQWTPGCRVIRRTASNHHQIPTLVLGVADPIFWYHDTKQLVSHCRMPVHVRLTPPCRVTRRRIPARQAHASSLGVPDIVCFDEGGHHEVRSRDHDQRDGMRLSQ